MPATCRHWQVATELPTQGHTLPCSDSLTDLDTDSDSDSSSVWVCDIFSCPPSKLQRSQPWAHHIYPISKCRGIWFHLTKSATQCKGKSRVTWGVDCSHLVGWTWIFLYLSLAKSRFIATLKDENIAFRFMLSWVSGVIHPECLVRRAEVRNKKDGLAIAKRVGGHWGLSSVSLWESDGLWDCEWDRLRKERRKTSRWIDRSIRPRVHFLSLCILSCL